MTKTSTIFAATLIAAASLSANAAPTELLQNGGFETGNLDGWSASTTLRSRCCETFSPNGTYVSRSGRIGIAFSGMYSAFGDFDGSGPGDILLSQSFNKTGTFESASLSFLYAAQVSAYGTLPRNLSISFSQGVNSVTVYSKDFGGNRLSEFGLSPLGQLRTSVGLNVTSALNSFSDGVVTMVVKRYIPESFTGPGYFGADNFSLTASVANAPRPAAAPVPEPESYAMLMAGLGVMGFVARRRQRASVKNA